MNELDGEAEDRGTARADPSIMIFLALFSLLLAFFILLNSLATREASRSAALLRSLGATFAGAATKARPLDPLELSRDALRAELGALLERTLPEAAAAPDERNGALRVSLPTGRLFREGVPEIHSKGAPLLAGVAELLRRAVAGRPEAEIRIGAAPGAAGELAVRRAGLLGRELERLGAPAGTFAVGLQSARPAEVEFAFRLRPGAERQP